MRNVNSRHRFAYRVTGIAIAAGMTASAMLTGSASAQADPSLLGPLNTLRTEGGCGPVTINAQLTAAAQRHAADMANSGVTGHAGSDGSQPDARITQAGYAPIGWWGEIVYWGVGDGATPQAAFNWWLNSPGHRSTMVNCQFTDVGLASATANGKMTAVGVFAKH